MMTRVGSRNGYPLGLCPHVLLRIERESTFCTRNSPEVPDLTKSWVNGSESLYRKEKDKWQLTSPAFGGTAKTHERKVIVTAKRHREHDELRYSVRSIFKYFGDGIKNIRILASDLYDGKDWVGQVPSWLDAEAAKKYGVSMLYTSQLYTDKMQFLPVFSSLSLESQFYRVPRAEPDDNIMIYLNDDMFLASEHSTSDFWSPLTGINVQVDSRVWVQNQDASVIDFQSDWNSEWTALRYSNYLLSRPFGIHAN
jgi:Stealth protein CR2, conserved region 2